MADCTDKRCPVHGEISVRGNIFTGAVISAKPGKTVIVEKTIVKFVPKYERYAKSKSRVYAHNPECINAKEDDVVKVGETRRLSKTKSFVVISIVGKKKIVKVEEDTFREHKRVKETDEGKEKAETEEKEKAGKAREEAEEKEEEVQEEEKKNSEAGEKEGRADEEKKDEEKSSEENNREEKDSKGEKEEKEKEKSE